MLRRFLGPLNDARKHISVLATLEVRSALNRRLHLHEITPEAAAIATRKLKEPLNQYPQLAIDDFTVETAADLIFRRRLRSLDALQLASALLVRDSLPPGDDLLFIASDIRLLEAAAAEALSTWNPADKTLRPPVN